MIILVFGKSQNQFLEFCRKNKISSNNGNLLYVHDYHKMLAVKDPLVLKLEGYWEHPIWDRDNMHDRLRARGRSGPPLELTEEQAVFLLEFQAKYPDFLLTYEKVEEYLKASPQLEEEERVSRETKSRSTPQDHS